MECSNCAEFIKERETCIFEKKKVWCLACWNQYVDGKICLHGGWHWSEESKQKMRGSKNPAKRPEVGKKISNALKNLYENDYVNPMQDNHHTDEAKQKMREKCLGKYTGEDNSNWRGGIGNAPCAFEFNEKFKTSIREKDNNTCQLCGKTKEEEGQNLAVHHIYYDKENSNVIPERFMTLCNSCNLKVNFKREYWTEFFQLKLEELKNGVLINAGYN